MEKEKNHTLWLCPAPNESVLSEVITSLSQHYNTPVFPPHITLLTGSKEIKTDHLDELFSTAVRQRCTQFDLICRSIEFDRRFFKSLYLTFNRSAALIDLFNTISSRIANHLSYDDLHLSLAYGLPEHGIERTVIIASLQHLLTATIRISRLLLVNTGNSIEKWSVVREYRLNDPA